MKCSFLEIYSEEIKDLLNPLSKRYGSIREDSNGAIYVSGVLEEEVKSAEEMMECLERGSASR